MHGRRMADGSMYHKDSLTCAHKKYPFGTLLKVTNLSNGKYVIVEVRDRGPFRRGRIVDLSYSAAKEIDMVSSGVINVVTEVIPENTIPLIWDPCCGLENVKFKLPYEYLEPVLKYPDKFLKYFEFKKVSEAPIYKEKRSFFGRKRRLKS